MKDVTSTKLIEQTPPIHKNWVYINGLGERDAMQVADSDILSAIKFSQSGEYLALGDNGGRVIIFKKGAPQSSANKIQTSRYFDYKYLTEI